MNETSSLAGDQRPADTVAWTIGGWTFVGLGLTSGLLQWLLADSSVVLWYSIGLAAVAGGVGLLGCMLRPRDVSIFDVLAASLCFGYGGGALNTFVRYALDGTEALKFSASRPSALGEAIALVLVVSALLVAWGRISTFRPLCKLAVSDAEIKDMAVTTALVVLMGILLMLTGTLGFQQNVSIDGAGAGRVSPIALTVLGVLPPMAAAAVHCAARAHGRTKWILSALAAIALLLLLTQGRRVFAFSLALCFMGYFAAGAKLPASWIKLVAIVVVVSLALQLSSRFFYAMRMAGWESTAPTPLTELVVKAAEISLDSTRYDLGEQLGENLRDRSFVLDYLGELLTQLRSHTPTYGEVFQLSAALLVPSMLWQGKEKVIALGSEEEVTHPHLGLPVWDAANTVLTSGLSDFGVLGALLYAIGYAVLYTFVLRASLRRGGVIYLVFCLTLFYGLLNVEAALAAMLVTLRQAALISLGLYLAFSMLDAARRRWPKGQSPEMSDSIGVAGAREMKLVLFAHPRFMQSQSMPRFAEMLQSALGAHGWQVEGWAPSPKAFNLVPTGRLSKWAGYIDQYVLFPLWVRRQLRRTVRADLYVFCDQALGPWVPLVKHLPHVVHCHDLLALRSALGDIPENPTSLTGKLYQRYIRWGFRQARHFISVSEKSRSDLHHFGGVSPVTSEVVYNGLNFPFARVPEVHAKEVLRTAGLPVSDRGMLLHVGGGQWYKNTEGVIAVYAHYARSRPDPLPLWMVSPSPNASVSRALQAVPSQGAVHFVQGIDNATLRAAYSMARAFIFPSLAEGFGWPIAEAMACGCPVLTTNEAPMSEVGGDAVRYLPRLQSGEDVDSWAKGCLPTLHQLLDSDPPEQARLRQAGSLQSARFDSGKAIEAYMRIYTQVLALEAGELPATGGGSSPPPMRRMLP